MAASTLETEADLHKLAHGIDVTDGQRNRRERNGCCQPPSVMGDVNNSSRKRRGPEGSALTNASAEQKVDPIQ